MTIQKTTAKDIVQIIKNKRDEVRFAVLLGAGTSVTAGIPSASEMIKELKKKSMREKQAIPLLQMMKLTAGLKNGTGIRPYHLKNSMTGSIQQSLKSML